MGYMTDLDLTTLIIIIISFTVIMIINGPGRFFGGK